MYKRGEMLVEKRIEITKQTDHDGFSTFECSLCSEEFKLVPGDVEEDHVLQIFCPSCGIPQEPSEFLIHVTLKDCLKFFISRDTQWLKLIG
jgi:hypothetical protein